MEGSLKASVPFVVLVVSGSIALSLLLASVATAAVRRRPRDLPLPALALAAAALTTWFGTFAPRLHSFGAWTTLLLAAAGAAFLRGGQRWLVLAAGTAWLACMLAARTLFPGSG